MSRNFDAIVIGSGLGGLTAGALTAHAGRRVLVLDRNFNFGGAATVYQHGALSIEASLHETTNPHDPNDPNHALFQMLGLLEKIEFVPVGNFYEVRSYLLKTPFVLPHDFHVARQALLSRFPDHKKALAKLFYRFNAVNRTMEMFSQSHHFLWWLIHAPTMPFIVWPVLRDLKKSLADIFQELFGDDEAIKIALAANLAYYTDDPEQMWWIFYAVAQGGFLSGGGHYIRGGSQVLSDCLVKAIEDNGGIAESGRVVTRILLDEQGEISGVEHEDVNGDNAQTDHARIVFGNAAPHVLAEALPTEVRQAFIREYADIPLSLSLFTISLGLASPPSYFGVSNYSTFIFPEWIKSLMDYKYNAALLSEPPADRLPLLTLVDYSGVNSGLNNQAPFLLTVVGLDQLSNWQDLSQEEYQHKRDLWLEAIIQRLEEEYPGIASAITQKEMSTAKTMHQYLNTPGGAIYGFAPIPPKQLFFKKSLRTPKTNIIGLWLASAYAGGGGFSGAMASGAIAARMAMSTMKK